MTAEFDQYAADYDRLLEEALPASKSEQYFAEYKIKLSRDRAQQRTVRSVLDFGCGTGRSIPFLMKLFPQSKIYGFDPSEECLSRARSHVGAEFVSDIDRLPHRSFDLILAANVFHHVPVEMRLTTLETCKSLLSAGGTISLFEHNPFNPLTKLVFERCVFDRGAHMLRMSETKRLAQQAGLTVRFTAYTLFFPPILRWLRFVEPALSKLPLGAQYYVEMEN